MTISAKPARRLTSRARTRYLPNASHQVRRPRADEWLRRPRGQSRGGDGAPYPGERRGVDGVVAQRVEKRRHRRLRRRFVTGDRQGAAVGRTGGPGQRQQVVEVDVVEGFDNVRPGQVPLEELSGGRGLVVQLGDLPVALRV